MTIMNWFRTKADIELALNIAPLIAMMIIVVAYAGI